MFHDTVVIYVINSFKWIYMLLINSGWHASFRTAGHGQEAARRLWKEKGISIWYVYICFFEYNQCLNKSIQIALHDIDNNEINI